MTLSPARRHSNWVKWLVSILLIAIFWRIGVYGVDWKSSSNVVALLVAIAVLAFCIAFWKKKSQT
jgi:amino acid transporter